MTRLRRVTEEVARWVFEVHLEAQSEWAVVFTNPTAGPWKRVMAADASGQIGEVHRFLREDTRPDLVLVSDIHEAIIIVEAKTRLEQLTTSAQASKTVAVVRDMGRLLRSSRSNRYWHRRADFTVMCGLLWGGEAPAGAMKRAGLAQTHVGLLPNEPWLSRSLLTVECLRERDQAHVSCAGGLEEPMESQDPWATKVLQSLKLDVLE